MDYLAPSPDQERAILKIKEGRSRYCLLTAGPGHGKSFVVQEAHRQGVDIIKSSTTGVSAININGFTINSVLGGYFDSNDMRKQHDTGRIYDSLKKMSGKTLVLDEVSMFSAAQFQILIINNERLWQSTGDGVYILFVGDFGQLPPVKEAPVFESNLWQYVDIITLTQTHRTSNVEFIDALRCLRIGESSKALPFFNSLGFHRDIDMEFEGTTLYALNDGARRHNEYSLAQLKGESKFYYPNKKGDPLPEWKNIPEPLELKLGALVILRSNQWEEGYVNGDQGYVVGLGPNYVDVDLLRGNRVRVTTVCSKHKTPTKRGEITYLPILLAYALTTHKAQSLSLDYLQVVLDDPHTHKNLDFMGRCHGMAFMAISRATTPEHLRIVGSPSAFVKACYTDSIYLPHIM